MARNDTKSPVPDLIDRAAGGDRQALATLADMARRELDANGFHSTATAEWLHSLLRRLSVPLKRRQDAYRRLFPGARPGSPPSSEAAARRARGLRLVDSLRAGGMLLDDAFARAAEELSVAPNTVRTWYYRRERDRTGDLFGG